VKLASSKPKLKLKNTSKTATSKNVSGIYERRVSRRYYWISRYISNEHVYLECSWCKDKRHVVTKTGGMITQATKRTFYGEFSKVHGQCKDPSYQLEMAV
jgi:hypothetical protein